MGTMTVSVKDDVEKRFRKAAAARYGRRKGSLGEAAGQAMEEWTGKETSVARMRELLEKGFRMGGMRTRKRSDWHDRQLSH